MLYNFCYFKDGIKPVQQVALPLNELGVLRGFAIFDFLRTYHLKPFLTDHYLQRFYDSAKWLNLPVTINASALEQIINELLTANTINEDVGIRIILTGGAAADSITMEQPLLYILIENLHPQPQLNYSGVKLITMDYLRPFPHIKTTHYINAIVHAQKVADAGAADILYYHNGHYLETTRNNFFLFKGETLVTPAENILIGRTRNLVLRLAEKNFEIEERPVQLNEIAEATEAFITGTTKGITPVIKIDDHQIGIGKLGPCTKLLMEKFRVYIEMCCK